MYNDTKRVAGGGLYSTADHLWWRDASFKPPRTTPGGEDIYWSRGNGWVPRPPRGSQSERRFNV